MQSNNVHHAHHRLGHSLFIGGAFLLLFGGIILAPLTTVGTHAFGLSDLLTGTNQARTQLNKRAFTINSDLMNAAQMRAEDMAKEHYFSHTAPDGTVAWDYFKKVGYPYEIAGENLAITNQSADSVIQGWLNSPTHRDNLLSENYTDIGIGMTNFGDYEGHKDTFVIVAFYGKRATVQVPAATTSPAGGTTALSSPFKMLSTTIILPLATLLMAIGLGLEVRHIRHLHHTKHLA